MSKIDVTSCDGCDAMAPPGYCWAYPAHGWIHIDTEKPRGTLHACSWACLATIVAARIAETVDA